MGSVVVLGRKSDCTHIDGEKIYLFDVERVILKFEKVKLCEVQTHPENDEKLVAHIVWENDAVAEIKQNPNLQEVYYKTIQDTVLELTKNQNMVPYCFCQHDSFPSAHSGKRDIKVIKSDVADLTEM